MCGALDTAQKINLCRVLVLLAQPIDSLNIPTAIEPAVSATFSDAEIKIAFVEDPPPVSRELKFPVGSLGVTYSDGEYPGVPIEEQ